jgi:hypothetical protein
VDNKLNNPPAEDMALTDEELDHASGGRVYHGVAAVYACDACMVWVQTRPGAMLIHKKCGKEMRYLKTAAEKQSVTENPQYQKVSPGEAVTC